MLSQFNNTWIVLFNIFQKMYQDKFSQRKNNFRMKFINLLLNLSLCVSIRRLIIFLQIYMKVPHLNK